MASLLLLALIIAVGVATVLHFAAGLPYLVAFGPVAVSEVILLFVGNTVLVRRVSRATTADRASEALR